MSIENIKELLGHRDPTFVRQGLALLEVLYQQDPSVLQILGMLNIYKHGLHFRDRTIAILHPRLLSLEVLCMLIRTGYPGIEVIEGLHLDDLELTTLPEEIRQLSALKSLSVDENYKLLFPDWLSEFSELATLKICDMNLREIPPIVGRLQALTDLRIAINPLSEFPTFLCKLPMLENIEMRMTSVVTLPEEIGELKKLKSLHCGGGILQSLPVTICQLHNLESLVVNANRLTELPESIGELRSLKELLLGRNPLKRLPESLGELSNLKYLQLMFPEGKEPIVPESISQLGETVTVIVRDDNEGFYKRMCTLLPNVKKVDPDPMLFGDGVY